MTEDIDWQARALAAEAERDELRVMLRDAMVEAHARHFADSVIFARKSYGIDTCPQCAPYKLAAVGATEGEKPPEPLTDAELQQVWDAMEPIYSRDAILLINAPVASQDAQGDTKDDLVE